MEGIGDVVVAVGVAVLGSTGSIGTSALDVLRAQKDHFRVVSLAAGKNSAALIEQAREFSPRLVSVADADTADEVRKELGEGTRVVYGPEGLVEAAMVDEASTVIAAVVGAVGIEAVLAALRANKRVALANKETLVAAGDLVTGLLKKGYGELLPVDSEHAAIHQCLNGARTNEVSRLILTASGGPFRTAPLDHINQATPAEALKHPTWNMGGKITIDSATLMNKGLEVIEAHWLFGMDYDSIDVVVHPQSIVHSLVEFVDGSVLAQLGAPDMRVPIQYALNYPERTPGRWRPFSLVEAGVLTFEPPDVTRFPALRLAYDAGRIGGTAPCVLNAANEVAVAFFLKEACRFGDIPACVEETLAAHSPRAVESLDDVLDADRWAREKAAHVLERLLV